MINQYINKSINRIALLMNIKRSIHLRKLDKKEVGIIKRGFDQNMTIRVRLRSQIDLFEPNNLEILKRSILYWKRMQKLLSSRIEKVNDSEYYFDYLDDSKQWYNFENVKLLRLSTNQANKDNEYESLSDLIFEHCILNEINPDKYSNQLLWYLYIFEMKDQVYDIAINYHHTIGQGKSSYLNILHLLQLVEKLHKNETILFKGFDVFKGCMNLFDIKEESLVKVDLPTLKNPSFLDPYRAKRTQLEHQTSKNLNPDCEIIYADTKNRFESVGNLLELSRINHIKYKTFYFEEESFSWLVSRCKEEKTKLTGCLELVSCLALKELYNKYGASKELDKVIYFIVMSLRELSKSRVNEETLGFCGGGLFNAIDSTQIDEVLKDRLSNFWPLARKLSQSLHARLKTDEWMDNLRTTGELSAVKNLLGHFLFSNVGDIRDDGKMDCFKIENLIVLSSFDEDKNLRLYANYCATLNGRLIWIIHYNSFFIDSYLIDDLANFSLSILNDISKL